MNVGEVLKDLLDEQEALDSVVTGLSGEQWAEPTPSPRWSVADQIAHLTYFDGTATLAISDPGAFNAALEELLAAAADGDEGVERLTLGEYRAMTPPQLLGAWRENRRRLATAAATLEDDTRVVWYGPSMGAKSFLTARLMEAWAHGQDIVDAVDGERPATDRLRHIAQLGYITRRWSYMNRGLDVPAGDVRLELTAPSGEVWTWGAGDEDVVTGSAEDFCLVATQRRHVDDTDLAVKGSLARDWLSKAQAFAGPATDGPAPKQG